MTTPSTAARYGVEAAREPKPKIMNCWMNEPPDLPVRVRYKWVVGSLSVKIR